MTAPSPPGPEPLPGLNPTPAPTDSSRLPDPGESGPGQRSSAEQVERPHPLTPLVRSWVLVLALAFAFGREALNETLGGGDPFTSPFPPDDFTPRFFGTELSVQWLGLIVPAILLLIVGFGYLSWRATRFVIDDQVLRLESGIIFRKSQRIAFDKVQSIDLLQPFAARLLGLAELRLDLGGGSSERLRYLRRQRAVALRDYLLSRARGAQAEVRVTDETTSLLTDLSLADEVLIRVQPQTLLLAALTSHEFFSILLGGLVSAGVGWYFGFRWGLIFIAIPIISSLIGFVGSRVTGQFNYTLSRRPHGVRISRGLTSLTSQSLPTRRVQAVQLSQSLLWRRLGLYRIDIEVLGLGDLTTAEGSSGTSSILLPAGSIEQVRVALAALWPRADFERIELEPTPLRARWLHPFSQPFLRWGHDEQLVVAQRGWLVRRWMLVPHARIQSVKIVTSPLSRRLRLADLEFHTAGLRINAGASGLDAAVVQSRQDELLRLVHHQPTADLSEPLPAPPDPVLPGTPALGPSPAPASGSVDPYDPATWPGAVVQPVVESSGWDEGRTADFWSGRSEPPSEPGQPGAGS